MFELVAPQQIRIIFRLKSLSLHLSSLSLTFSTEIIHAEPLHVVQLTSHSAVLQWRPVLSEDSSYYGLLYKSILKTDPEVRRTLPFDSSSVGLTDLQPDTTYTASLHPESNKMLFDTLTVTFTTLPGRGS